MTIRAILWSPTALKSVRELPRGLREQVRAHLAALSTGSLPPQDALPDPEIPDTYHLVTAQLTLICGVYAEEVRVWIVRANT